MRTLAEVKPLTDFVLQCRFSDGVSKNADIKPFLKKEAFLSLNEKDNFLKVINRNYFVEWQGLDIDLSADTLWHIGV